MVPAAPVPPPSLRMPLPPTCAKPKSRHPGRALLAFLAALGILACLLSAPTLPAPEPGLRQEIATAAGFQPAYGDQAPSDDTHPLVVRKKNRRNALSPVDANAAARAAMAIAWAALTAAPAAAARPPVPDRERVVPASTAPQLRLHPGQAPPAA